MKPTRNRFFCSAIRRPKMLFESQEKADNFIRFNASEMADDENDEYVPIRSYYCTSCGGWHVTHHVETKKQKRLDYTQEIAYQLERFINRLKQSYTNKDWKKWEPQMEVANEWVAMLERVPSYYNFLSEAKRQLARYQSMMDKAATKEENCARHETNLLTSKRKRLFENIRNAMLDMDIIMARNSALSLCELMDEPAYTRFEPQIKEECEELVKCFRDSNLYTIVMNVTYILTGLKGSLQYLPAGEFRKIVDELNAQLSELQRARVHRYILQPFNETVIKLVSKVNTREQKEDDTTIGMENPLPVLQKYYDTVKRHLVDCINSLMTGDRQASFVSLTAADESLKVIPVSLEKVKLMTLFMQVVQSSKLFEQEPEEQKNAILEV